MRLIRVMCSGRVDVAFVLRAFSKGADGVFIGACHLGECNYITHGNYQALTMVHLLKKVMKHIGLNPERLHIAFMSGSEASLYVEKVNQFVKTVKGLGPIGKAEGMDQKELGLKLEAVTKLIPYFRLVEREKLRVAFKSEDEISDFFASEKIERLFQETLADELALIQREDRYPDLSCRERVAYHIDSEACQACGMCLKKCPSEAISGEKKQVHVIDQERCTRCGTCYVTCPSRFRAVRATSDVPMPPPVQETARLVVRESQPQ